MAKRLKTASDVRRILAAVANDVLNGNISEKRASTFTYVCTAILQSIRVDEQDKRMDELETMIQEIIEQH